MVASTIPPFAMTLREGTYPAPWCRPCLPPGLWCLNLWPTQPQHLRPPNKGEWKPQSTATLVLGPPGVAQPPRPPLPCTCAEAARRLGADGLGKLLLRAGPAQPLPPVHPARPLCPFARKAELTRTPKGTRVPGSDLAARRLLCALFQFGKRSKNPSGGFPEDSSWWLASLSAGVTAALSAAWCWDLAGASVRGDLRLGLLAD